MVEEVQNYFHQHEAVFESGKEVVRQRAMDDAESDINDFLRDLFDDSMSLRQQYPFYPPENGQGPDLRRPKFTRLKALVTDGNPFTLVGRMNNALGSSNAAARRQSRGIRKKRKRAAKGKWTQTAPQCNASGMTQTPPSSPRG